MGVLFESYCFCALNKGSTIITHLLDSKVEWNESRGGAGVESEVEREKKDCFCTD